MSYLLLDAVFLAAAAAVAVALLGRTPRGHAAALGLGAVALLVLTALFDNLMIAAGLFAYDPAQLTGIRIGLAPLEDFAYPVAGVLLLGTLWGVLDERAAARGRGSGVRR